MPSPPRTLISGGSRGLGLALVEHLLARGDRVATFSRSGSEALSALAAAHPEQLVAENLDITDSPAIGGFIARMASRFGRLDHCIANAAIAHEGVLATMRDDEIDSMLAVNLRGSIIFIRECVRQMLAATAPADRSITVVSSVVAENGSPGLAVYAATKAAVNMISESLRIEGQGRIKVSIVRPTGVPTTGLGAGVINRRASIGMVGHHAETAVAKMKQLFSNSLPAEFSDPERIGYFALDPGVVADTILHVIDQPWGVSISDITVRAAGEPYLL